MSDQETLTVRDTDINLKLNLYENASRAFSSATHVNKNKAFPALHTFATNTAIAVKFTKDNNVIRVVNIKEENTIESGKEPF